MFLFRRHKKLNHKQCSVIGFVLAVMSLLTNAVITYGFPRFGALLNAQGIYGMDFFLLGFMITLFLAVQALLLFGFPLHYANDKKSHMTGFQILIYALLWMIVLILLIAALFMLLNGDASAVNNVDDLLIQ